MKFAVITLPRSRSAWLAQWLGCSHEPLAECGSLDELTPEGVVDTGSALFFPAFWKRWPKARYLFIFRNLAEIQASARKVGLCTQDLPELDRRLQEAYARVRDYDNVLAVSFDRLSHLPTLSAIWRHLKGDGFDAARTQRLIDVNIQADLGALFHKIDPARTRALIAQGRAESWAG